MKMNTMKMSLRMMIVLMGAVVIANGVAAQDAAAGDAADNSFTAEAWGNLGAGIALGLAAIGAGYAQGGIGSAAVGMLAEDDSKFGAALIFTALPESLVILGMMPLFIG